MRFLGFMAGLALCVSARAALAQGSEEELAKPRVYEAGDLGLEQIDNPEKKKEASALNLGVGINATLSPSLFTPAATRFLTNLSVRMWFDRLMIEPVLGMAFTTADPEDIFQIQIGALFGYAIGTKAVRPFIGAGVITAFTTTLGPKATIAVGPQFGLEFRFEEFPELSLDAALFLPFEFDVDPFNFRFGTAGGAVLGFHYFF